MKKLLIYGSGSVGRLIVQFIKDINEQGKMWDIIGFLDDNPKKSGLDISGYPVLGGMEQLPYYPEAEIILAFSVPTQRRNTSEKLKSEYTPKFATIVHPSTWISDRVSIGVGSIIYPGAHIDVDVTIGRHTLINKLSSIGHDTNLGDYCTVSPGVNIGGNVKIGSGCDFGIGSSTIQGLSIGESTVIGAGAVVVKALPDNCTAVGVPAKAVKFHREV